MADGINQNTAKGMIKSIFEDDLRATIDFYGTDEAKMLFHHKDSLSGRPPLFFFCGREILHEQFNTQ